MKRNKYYYNSSISFGNEIRRIEKYSFKGSKVEKVIVPINVEEIESKAFEECRNLKTVIIDNPNIKLENNIFKGCDLLSNIKLPEGMKSIPQGMFCECESLRRIDLPDSIIEIQDIAFANCINLKDIKFSNRIKEIGRMSFINTAITQLVIPDTVRRIGMDAFYSCRRLNEIYLSRNCFTLEESVFAECENIKEIIIPANVNLIKSNAFAKCESLTKITFIDEIPEINLYAFYNCKNPLTLVFKKPDMITAKDLTKFLHLILIDRVKGYKNTIIEEICKDYGIKFESLTEVGCDWEGHEGG